MAANQACNARTASSTGSLPFCLHLLRVLGRVLRAALQAALSLFPSDRCHDGDAAQGLWPWGLASAHGEWGCFPEADFLLKHASLTHIRSAGSAGVPQGLLDSQMRQKSAIQAQPGEAPLCSVSGVSLEALGWRAAVSAGQAVHFKPSSLSRWPGQRRRTSCSTTSPGGGCRTASTSWLTLWAPRSAPEVGHAAQGRCRQTASAGRNRSQPSEAGTWRAATAAHPEQGR